ncbi:MAG: hypothetical protein HY465_01925, partial [Deltaproteobacteria bacterium]|nr:hypothetical protein [Deltaproteobacteria bacterium]
TQAADYTYDDQGQIISTFFERTIAGGSNIEQFEYTYVDVPRAHIPFSSPLNAALEGVVLDDVAVLLSLIFPGLGG